MKRAKETDFTCPKKEILEGVPEDNCCFWRIADSIRYIRGYRFLV